MQVSFLTLQPMELLSRRQSKRDDINWHRIYFRNPRILMR